MQWTWLPLVDMMVLSDKMIFLRNLTKCWHLHSKIFLKVIFSKMSAILVLGEISWVHFHPSASSFLYYYLLDSELWPKLARASCTEVFSITLKQRWKLWCLWEFVYSDFMLSADKHSDLKMRKKVFEAMILMISFDFRCFTRCGILVYHL